MRLISSSDMDSLQYIQSDPTSYVSDDVRHSEGLYALSSIHVHEELLPVVHSGVNIPICEGFLREQWVGFDVVLLDHMRYFKTLHPMNVLTPTSLGRMMWGLCFELLAPFQGALELEKFNVLMATSTSAPQWSKPLKSCPQSYPNPKCFVGFHTTTEKATKV